MEVYPNTWGASYIKATAAGVAEEASTPEVERVLAHLGPFKFI